MKHQYLRGWLLACLTFGVMAAFAFAQTQTIILDFKSLTPDWKARGLEFGGFSFLQHRTDIIHVESADGRIFEIDLATGRKTRHRFEPPERRVFMPAWSPDGRYVIYVDKPIDTTGPNDIYIYDETDKTARHFAKVNKLFGPGFVWRNNTEFFVSAGGAIYHGDVTRRSLRAITKPEPWRQVTAYAADIGRLYYVQADSTGLSNLICQAHVTAGANLEAPETILNMSNDGGGSVTRDGRYMVIANGPEFLLIDLMTRTPLTLSLGKEWYATIVVISPNGDGLLANSSYPWRPKEYVPETTEHVRYARLDRNTLKKRFEEIAASVQDQRVGDLSRGTCSR